MAADFASPGAVFSLSDAVMDPLSRRQAAGVSASRPAASDATRWARDGSMLRWGGAEDTPGPPPLTLPGAPVPITIAVSPVRPGHAVTVEFRVNGGPVCEAAALPELRIPALGARMFRAVLPGQPDGMVEFLPVLRFAGQR